MPGLRYAMVNMDNPRAAALLEQLPSCVTGLSYPASNPEADLYLAERVDQRAGVSGLLVSPWGKGEIHTRLLGGFNLGNLLAAIAAACCQGHPLGAVLGAVSRLQAAPRRMQPVVVDEDGQSIQVIEGYANKPAALTNSLH